MSLLYFNFFRESNLGVYLLEKEDNFATTVKDYKDIGPDFNFNLKVSSCRSEMNKSFKLFTTTICWFTLKRKFMAVIQLANVYLFLQVSTGTVPVSLIYLTVSLPNSTRAGNPLLYTTSIKPSPVRNYNKQFLLHTMHLIIHHKYMTESSVCACGYYLMTIFPATG